MVSSQEVVFILEHKAKSERPVPEQACKCPYCQRYFESVDALTLHIVTQHTQIKVRRGPAQAGSSGR